MRVPFADQGLNKIPDEVTDRQALLVGDVLATGYWAALFPRFTEEDTVLIIGAGPTGICTLLCVMLKKPKRIIMCEKDENVLTLLMNIIRRFLLYHRKNAKSLSCVNSAHGGADVVLEAAGSGSYISSGMGMRKTKCNCDCGGTLR